MKKVLLSALLSLAVVSTTFASFPVNTAQDEITVSSEAKVEVSSKKAAKAEKRQEKFNTKILKVQKKLENKKAKGDDNTTAIILAVVSVLLLPLGLHNWYLGRKKQALWQTLLVIPGLILLVPPLISWIWQIVDLVRLLGGGLPE